jgi:hypothetical protein
MYVLSGFETQTAYEARETSWEPEDEFADVASAEAIAQAWVVARGSEAQVEVIRLEGQVGDVVAVVTCDGTEYIG